MALEVARRAGELLEERFAAPRTALHSKTSPTDAVTASDLEAERLIRDRLAALRPEDAVLAEEGGESDGASGLRWVVDPLDGTVNFLFGIPQWAVSVACEDDDGLLCGVVHAPVAG